MSNNKKVDFNDLRAQAKGFKSLRVKEQYVSVSAVVYCTYSPAGYGQQTLVSRLYIHNTVHS